MAERIIPWFRETNAKGIEGIAARTKAIHNETGMFLRKLIILQRVAHRKGIRIAKLSQ